MMVKIQELINPLIFNNKKYIGFFGDSEYKTENDMIMGYWSFVGIIDKKEEDEFKKNYHIFRISDMIDDKEIYDTDDIFLIYDKNENICGVRFHYHAEN